MKNSPAYPVVFILLVFATQACSLGFVGFSTDSQVPPDVLFQDDFSDPSSGWDQFTNVEFETGYQNGRYQIRVKADSRMVWAKPGLVFSDVIIETEAAKTQGTDDNTLGILCRYSENQETPSFYFFAISSDGFYAIGKMVNGTQALISSENMQFSAAIQQSNLTNHLRVECVGHQLVLQVNGQELARVTDETLISGGVGLVAGTFSPPETVILFDNFVVRRP